jgi:membrane protease YdiL (CAAX protease family)
MLGSTREVLLNLFYNEHQNRLRAGWRIFIQFLFFILMTSISGMFILILEIMYLLSSGKIQLESLVEPDSLSLIISNLTSGIFFMLNAVITLLIITAGLWMAARWIDKRLFKNFGFHFSNRWWQDFVIGLLLGVLLMSLIFGFEWLAGWIEVRWVLNLSSTGFSSLLLFFFSFIGYICVGIYEEMLFRGYLLRNLAEGLNFGSLGPRGGLVMAYLISSTIFSLFHLLNPATSWMSLLNLILAGLFLGLGFFLTGELAIPIGIHITWNFFQGNVFGFPVSGVGSGVSLFEIQQNGPVWLTGGDFGPEAGLIGVFAILLGSLLTLLYVKFSRKQLLLNTNLAIYKSGSTDQGLEPVFSGNRNE